MMASIDWESGPQAVDSIPNPIVALNFDGTDFNSIGNIPNKFRGLHEKTAVPFKR